MDTEQTHFNLAQVTLYSYTENHDDVHTVTIHEGESESIEADIEYIDTPQTVCSLGRSALYEHVDGCGWESVVEGFESVLVNHFHKHRDDVDEQLNIPITCVVGIQTTWSNTYYHEFGCYESDSHAWITGIIDTSNWNAESFEYTVKHPDWKED